MSVQWAVEIQILFPNESKSQEMTLINNLFYQNRFQNFFY